MENQKITILGTEYDLIYKGINEDEKLVTMDGYFDDSTKILVVNDMKSVEGDITAKSNLKVYRDSVARHEIIHGYLYESGLSTECEWFNEEMVDWLAIQIPKIVITMKEANVL